MHKVFTYSFAKVYVLYIAKVERKNRTVKELDTVIRWLTGYDQKTLQKHIKAETNFQDFFAAANINPLSDLITGSVCGVKVQEIEDPLMRQIRMLDKLVDELAKGRPLEKILRN